MRYQELVEQVDKNKIESLLEEYFEVTKDYPQYPNRPTTQGSYQINKDGTVNVSGDVTIRIQKKIEKLPVKFGKIAGSFRANNSPLATLEGSPRSVGGWFDCSGGTFTSLIGGPIFVNGLYHCYGAPLTSLEGFPKNLGGRFYATWNAQMPLLRTLQVKQGVGIVGDQFGNVQHPITEIINKYKGHTNLRHAILDCQRDMIAAGYEGNARW